MAKKQSEQKYEGPTKRLVVIRGRGTKQERTIETNVILYWSPALRCYVSIPE